MLQPAAVPKLLTGISSGKTSLPQNKAPVIAKKTKPGAPKTKAAQPASAAKKSTKPVIFSSKSKKTAALDEKSGWSKAYGHAVTGNTVPDAKLNMLIERMTVQAWENIKSELDKPGITLSRVGELFVEAGGEFAKEIYEGILTLVEFGLEEMRRIPQGQELQTVEIGRILGHFVKDEAMRFAADENLESVKMIKEMYANLKNMDSEQRIKEGFKIAFSCVPLGGAAKGIKGAVEVSKLAPKAVGVVNKAGIGKGAVKVTKNAPSKIIEKGQKSVKIENANLPIISGNHSATKVPPKTLIETTPTYNFHRKLTSESLNVLAKPVDQSLINKLSKKGWEIVIAKPGTDNWRWLEYNGADASFNTGVPKHILIKEGAPKSALLEEFLHGTQNDLNLIKKYASPQHLEVHVKDFMLRHVKLLGLNNPHDIELLQQLKIEEVDRLRKMKT